MAETSPGDVRGTERLHEYWVHGAGAAKIRWGQPGDYDRCVLHLGKFIADPHGYCAKAHHDALGIWPATHAAMEKKATGRSTVSTPDGGYDGDGLDSSWDGDCSDLPDLAGLDVSHLEAAERETGGSPPPETPAQRAMPKLGTGRRFAKLKSSLAAKGAANPGALAAYIGRRKFGKAKFAKLAAHAKGSSRAESLMPFYRNVPFEDISIRSGGDGRTVEAYAAVFNTPAPVRDEDGTYIEELDPVVFNRAISDARPQGSRKNWRIGVFYNHGRTIMGTPSDRYSMPCGKILDVKADDRGLWTEIRYHRSAVGDEVLENIREGAPGGYSFSGMFRRSTPLIPRGGFRPHPRTGELTTVRRTESTLKELGWTPFPVYEKAEVTGVRALFGAMADDPDLAMRMLGMFRDGAPDGDSPPLSGAPLPGDSPAEDSHPVLVRSGRSVKQEMQAARSAFLQRYRR